MSRAEDILDVAMDRSGKLMRNWGLLFFSEDFSPLTSAAEDIASGHAMKVFN